MKIEIGAVKKFRRRESQTRMMNGSRDTRWEFVDEKGTCTTNKRFRYQETNNVTVKVMKRKEDGEKGDERKEENLI